MAKARRRAATPAASASAARTSPWAALTWDTLTAWAGSRSVSRGRSYARRGQVRDLAVSAQGRLLATVLGGSRYVTSVWLGKGRNAAGLRSQCTCPVGAEGCKHAVAVVAAYLTLLGGGGEAPPAASDDPRWKKLERLATGADLSDWDEDDLDEDDLDQADDDADFDEQPGPRTGGGARAVKPRGRRDWDEQIKQHIFGQSREELAELVWSLTQRFDEVRDEFRERIAASDGDADRLLAQARKELHRVSSQEGWRNHWTGEGSLPDYSKLRRRLERLVEIGQADAVAALGREVIRRGMQQVESSHDEGETAVALGECLPVIFAAVVKSSARPADKLLYAIDAHLQDEYDLLGAAAEVVFEGKYEPADWSDVADELARRLGPAEPRVRAVKRGDHRYDAEDFSRNYRRDQISHWLIEALSRAGREGEVLAVYEREARTTGSYERLVRFLMEQKRYDDAQRWAAEGIEKTAGQWAGAAASLAGQLCELARLRRQWDVVAAHAAGTFFDQPDGERLKQLIAAAARAGCEKQVRRLAQQFLETGAAPVRVVLNRQDQRRLETDAEWPLPVPAYLIPLLRPAEPRAAAAQPHYGVLIDIAIADKRLDEALAWYDRWGASSKQASGWQTHWSGPGAHADRVADAVAATHPHRAAEIYRARVNQHLPQASMGAYETVAAYLRKMKPVMQAMGREQDWDKLLEEIRLQYRNRPNFMEILDRFDRRPIVATIKRRR